MPRASFNFQSRILILAGVLILLSGCIVNPIYHLKDLIRIPAIEGIWEPLHDDNDPEPDFNSWEITKADSGKYYIRFKTDNRAQYYIAGFLKLNGTLYADLADIDHIGNNYTVEGTHSVLKISLNGDTLGARMMDLDYLDRCIRSKKYKLPYEVSTDRSSDYNTGTTIFVTATTQQLQDFLKANEADTLLFSKKESFVLRRSDTGFRHYFPEDAWNFEKLRSRADAPAILKASSKIDWYNKKTTTTYGFIDSLATAGALYKPFYFRMATFVGVGSGDTLDSALESRYTAYVLDHTREFLHFFNGSTGGSQYVFNDWAELVRRSSMRSGTLDAAVTRLKASCNTCSPKEQRLLDQFVQSVSSGR